MTPTERILLNVYAGIVIVWVIRHAAITWIFSRLDVLKCSSPAWLSADAPRVTAIIPAKDEEASLGGCLESVCIQNYPNFDILVVNDRSADRTAAIAEQAAEADSRIRLVSIAHLPDGWTGKNNALRVAAAEAGGDWLWFLDADTRHSPQSLSVMMEYARSHQAAMASLVPEMRCESFWERVVQPLAGIVLMRSFPLFQVNNDSRPMAFANGQYILIRRDAYESCGGHAAVRGRFVEDIFLAKRLKSMGFSIRVATSREISSTRMYTSLHQIVKGWSRILYDALDRKPWPLFGKILEPLFFSHTGDIALIVSLCMLVAGVTGPFVFWLLGLSVVHQILKTSVLYRMYKFSSPKTAWSAVWYPLAGVVMIYVCILSIKMCLTGKVTWRGTVYGPPSAEPATPVS